MAKTNPMRRPSMRVIADQVQFRLPQKQWKEFCHALDTSPKRIAALRTLLTRSGPFDVPENQVRLPVSSKSQPNSV